MDRLTDPAQGYCEMYCKEYSICFAEPETCEHKAEVAMYEKLKEIEGIVPFDRLLELAFADRDGRCDIHKVKDGETVYSIFAYVNGLHIRKSNGEPFDKIASYVVDDFTRNTVDREYGKTVFLTREAAEAALKGAQDG